MSKGGFFVRICATLTSTWRGGEVVTRESAKLLCRGSIPLRASLWQIRKKAVGMKQQKNGRSEEALLLDSSGLLPGLQRYNMKNPEYEKSSQETNDQGFSEKEMDLDIEVRAGEWQNLKKFKTFQKRSRQGKIIATYQAVSNRLNQLVSMYYKLVADNPTKAKKLLEELRKLRIMQEYLLQCLVWEPKGELSKDMVPKDIWELIE